MQDKGTGGQRRDFGDKPVPGHRVCGAEFSVGTYPPSAELRIRPDADKSCNRRQDSKSAFCRAAEQRFPFPGPAGLKTD